ncbi:TetR/AcrR family transcriptional regulator [Lentzea flaviverrucosa]|uniref:Transcriptional regulator, TetR family n=1 Tax=Lentzea flaviverrucosa TaxID=200379 RepID=A0A1H9XXP3_9PSEU|nr:TetR/AcrR family transcriptional regulator [Lentzea flaviverrucosa]RDI17079.1 TetR family transcriptional regulator [Lentzea flaviverrucosa]SES50849.1 transcriptional regulator, TetR family [Lentzea flaviverrucosa]
MAGRPRDPDLEQRLLATAWSLLTSHGYDALTLTQVAAQSGAHRTDVYRRWRSKVRLVADVLDAYLPPVPDPDTGTLHGDLRAFAQDLAGAWDEPWNDGLVGFLADLRGDAEAGRTFRALAVRRSQPLVDAIARAVRRGEITEVPELPFVGNLLEGPVMHRRMFGGAPMTPEELDVVTWSVHRLLTGTTVKP